MNQPEVDLEDSLSTMSDDFDTRSRCKLMGEKEYNQKATYEQKQNELREYREKVARKYRFVIG